MSDKAPKTNMISVQNEDGVVDDSSLACSIANPARRRFSKLGAGAPVLIMTVLSKPVFGAQCLSNMLSGNLSDPDRGTCVKGDSPGGWKNPGGSVKGFSTLDAWTKAGFVYGVLTPGANAAHSNSYTGGSTAGTAPFDSLLTVDDSTTPLRVVLKNDPGSLNAGIILAYLNAALSENTGTFQYVFTTAQVVGLVNGSIPLPPNYSNLHNLFYSTW